MARQRRNRIKRIHYKGYSFQDCPYCGTPLVWLLDPRNPGRKVPIVRGSWMNPVENRVRYWVRKTHRFHYCPARLDAVERIRRYEERAARPAWAQDPVFDDP